MSPRAPKRGNKTGSARDAEICRASVGRGKEKWKREMEKGRNPACIEEREYIEGVE